MVLESLLYPESSFVTLTYDKKNKPEDGSLNPRHTQLFIKRLRKMVPQKIRYYLVGEYGDKTFRPHYHLALFNLSPLASVEIEKAWNKGLIHVGELTPDSAQYIVGYVTKKMTKKTDSRLEGRYPEFARMSNRPGIGAHAMQNFGASLKGLLKTAADLNFKDVPHVLRHENKLWPLGRYLRRKLRAEIGRSEETPEAAKNEYLAELRRMLIEDVTKEENASKSLKTIKIEKDIQKIRNVEKRSKIYKQRKIL